MSRINNLQKYIQTEEMRILDITLNNSFSTYYYINNKG